ncbi:MAG: iron uptake protein, partial [Burkholderiaceae bacterium]
MRSTPSRKALAGRLAVALLGGYAFCWGLVAAGVASLYALGMPFHDAEMLSSMLAFLIYLGAVLWAIAARRLVPVAAVLFGGAAVLA